jgi:hypothetical protein
MLLSFNLRLDVTRPIAISLALLLETTATGITSARADNWAIYREGGSGCQVSYPKNLFKKDARKRGATRFSGPDDKTLFRIMEAGNEGELSLPRLKDKYFNIPGKVTYQRTTTDFLVLSGYRRDRIFYTRVELSSDRRTICIFEITYPKQRKGAFDRLVTRMSHSFSVQ